MKHFVLLALLLTAFSVMQVGAAQNGNAAVVTKGTIDIDSMATPTSAFVSTNLQTIGVPDTIVGEPALAATSPPIAIFERVYLAAAYSLDKHSFKPTTLAGLMSGYAYERYAENQYVSAFDLRGRMNSLARDQCRGLV